MTKRNWMLIIAALLLACIYVYHFTGWFKTKTIQISYTQRPSLSRGPARPGQPTILFGFGGQPYQLSEVEVVALDSGQINPATVPVWHLTADSRSAPVDFFRYGQNLPGMKPAVPGSHPEPLKTNVTYRLLVHAGSLGGQCDFQLGGRPPATSPQQ
ncbi:MAG TPA: hypothetical protein VG077_01235 [Verrucomicrobiae bacterium]|nr:hypothetical protein [Verrucomicrobiae bacterium]